MDQSAFSVSMLILGLFLGGLLGCGMTWLFAKAGRAQLEARCEADQEKLAWMENADQSLKETFEALASKSLRRNAQDFSGRINDNLNAHAKNIDVLRSSVERNVTQNLESHAKHISTLKAALEISITRLDGGIQALEIKREGAYQSLKQQVVELQASNSTLRQTTQQLLSALKSGPVRGRWGEIQLRKIIELAGMSEHVSFVDQLVGPAGGRPDTIVHLPNEGRIPIDSKFPLNAYLQALEAIDEECRKAKIKDHVRALREQIKELAKRNYWKEFDPSPELTIMFIPIESCLAAAYEHDPEIIEFALDSKIILASPTSLLGFMKSIAYGWQQFTINKNARQILVQGKELYDRLSTWMEHYKKTGERITAVAKAYNESVASLESRFLPSCRRFQDLTAIPDELPEASPVLLAVNPPTRQFHLIAEAPRSHASTPDIQAASD